MAHTHLTATRLTIRIPLLIVISSLCIVVVAGSVAAWSFYQSSRDTIEANLALQAHSKRNEVDALLASTRHEVLSAANDPLVRKALDNVSTSIKIMTPDRRAALREAYQSDTTAAPNALRSLSDYYGRAYDEVQPYFRSLAGEFGYGDILFVDPDGTIAYTLAKRTDYMANVRDFAGSALADVFGRAANQPSGTAHFADLRVYAPAGRPVALVGVPVYGTGDGPRDFVGVLVFEVSSRKLDAILSETQGTRVTGRTILVGADGKVRAAALLADASGLPEHLLEDVVAGQPASTRVVETTDSAGQSVIATAAPVAVKDLGWTVIAMQDSDQVFQPIRQMVGFMLSICLLMTLLLTLLAVRIAARIGRPVIALVERFDAALTNMPHGLVMVDAARRLILCNAAYREMYDLPFVFTQTGTALDVLDAHQAARGLPSPEPVEWLATGSWRRDLHDGRTIDIVRNALPSGGFVGIHQNMTAAVQAQEQIAFLATHDALTHLPNRTSFGERIEEALDRVRGGSQLAVLCLDLDHFKAVNDTLGHPVGDLLLKAVAARMTHCLRGSDVLARLGGDEFVILQGEIDTPDDARRLAQRLIEQIGVPFELNGHQVVVGLSIGIAIAPTDGTDADALIKNADLALYRAKADRRGVLRFFEQGMDAELQARRQLELDLRLALVNDQFELNYQPVFDTATQRMTGVEALLRWRHPERGTVSPGDFIPLAEERGLIVPIGDWVIRKACADAATWPDDIRVAVNLSPVQLKSPGLVDSIVDTLARTGLSPLRLELEITEMVLLSDDAATLATLHALKKLGLRIAMDDFGTGYSSLSYLRSFPFDKIKIDQSFVRELGQRPDAVAIIKAISDLATTLGMATTVEGIETSEQLLHVRKQGCTEVQGYFLCRPSRYADVVDLIAQREGRPRLSA